MREPRRTGGTAVRDARRPPKRRGLRWFLGINLGLAGVSLAALLMALARMLPAAEAVTPAIVVSDRVVMAGLIAAAASTGISALAAAYAVSHVGAAALGAMGERPELAGRALIFVGLAEGIAIYGLIISIMILGRLG